MGTVASADTLDILGPSAAVPPEGFSIAVVRRDASGAPVSAGSATVSASGARLVPGPPQPPLRTFLVVPEPEAREVRVSVRAADAQAQAAYTLGPPATQVSLSLEPAAPVKGRDKDARLTVRMLRPDGLPEDSGAAPVVRANVGRVEALARSGPGTWTARYVLPDTRYPEVAVLVALSAWPHPQSIHGAYGRVLVPLAASVELPGRTEPNAQLTITLAGTSFGPVKVAADGRFRLPIIVPPGHDTAQANTVDAAGNMRRSTMSLGLPPTDGLACVLHPQRLPADGHAQGRLLCATSDPLGRPVQHAHVAVTARHGTLRGPSVAEGGLLEWRYTAPVAQPATPEKLVATWPERGEHSREELPLQFDQGPVARMDLELSESPVHEGSTVRLTARAWDASGLPRAGAVVVPDSRLGTFGVPREVEPGVIEFTWSVPEVGADQTVLMAHAYGPLGLEPARLSVWVDEGQVFAGVTDLFGLPVPGQPLGVGDTEYVTGGEGLVRLGPASPGHLEVVHRRWPGLRRTLDVVAEGGPIFPLDFPPRVPRVSRPVALAPATPVNVRVRVEGARVTYWVEDAAGQVLADRETHVALSAGQRDAVEEKEGKRSFLVKAPGPVSVSVADVATGITALVEVRP